MARFTVLSDHAPYFEVRVEFGGETFDQLVVSTRPSEKIAEQLQAYADEYAAAWQLAEDEQLTG